MKRLKIPEEGRWTAGVSSAAGDPGGNRDGNRPLLGGRSHRDRDRRFVRTGHDDGQGTGRGRRQRGSRGQDPFPPAYQASKAAVINLTRNLAASWADRGVRVNAIAPGWFPSEMTAPWFAIPEFLDRVEQQAAVKRVGDPEELIGALLYFASDASRFTTGQTLAVDGGLSATIGTFYYVPEIFEAIAGLLGEYGEPIRPA